MAAGRRMDDRFAALMLDEAAPSPAIGAPAAPTGVSVSTGTNRAAALSALAAVAVTLVGFALRLHGIGEQSLWYDEGVSAAMTRRPVWEIPGAAAGDVHPPLYYVALHLWSHLAGTSEWALRLLSALAGTLTLPLVYRLGARLASRPAGLAAAALLAVQPVHVYYSQEARMYALAGLFVTGAAAALVEFVLTDAPAPGGRVAGRWRAPAVYAACALGAIYTHYFTGAAVASVALWGLLARPGRWRAWLTAQAAALVLYLPWLPRLNLGNVDARRTEATVGWWDVAAQAWRELLLGVAWQPPDWVLPAFGATLALGAVVALAARRRILPVLWLAVPFLAIVTLSVGRPLYQVRFLVPVLPALALLLGYACDPLLGAAARFGRFAAVRVAVAVGAAAALAWVWWPATVGIWADPAQRRDDFRGLVGFVTERAGPNDAVLLDAPGQREIFEYYHRGSLPVYGLPAHRFAGEAETVGTLEDISRRFERLWVVYWAEREADPRGIVPGWLDRSAWKSLDRWFGGPRLAVYETRGNAPVREVGARFGDAIRLESVALGEARTPSGGAVPLTLTWRALAPVATRYTVFAHLLDAAELLYGGRDAEPAGGGRPTTGWAPGDVVEDRIGLPVLEGTVPGRYALEIGLYDAATGARLPVTGADGSAAGDRLIVGDVEVGPPAPGAPNPAPPRPLAATVGGGLSLAGYSLTIVGDTAERDRLPRAETAQLNLFWTADPAAGGAAPRSARLVSADGLPALGVALRPGGDGYPPADWRPGSLVREQLRLPLGSLPPGAYRLEVWTGTASVPLTTVTVEASE